MRDSLSVSLSSLSLSLPLSLSLSLSLSLPSLFLFLSCFVLCSTILCSFDAQTGESIVVVGHRIVYGLAEAISAELNYRQP